MELHSLDLNKLHAFLAVAGEGGVSAAGRRLAVTRSAVSQSIAGLEASLGVRLFHRLGRRLVPTREGELLHRRLADYQSVLARTLDEIASERGELAGPVRLGVYLGFPRPILAGLVARLSSRHPEARVQVHYAAQEELRERLLAARLDVAFSLRRGRAPRREIRSTPLFAQELVLVASRAHFRPELAIADLERTPVIDYYRSDPLIERWIEHHAADAPAADTDGRRDHGGRAAPRGRPQRGARRRPALLADPRRVRPDVRVWAATTDLVLELVLSRVGVAVLPRSLVERHIARGRLFHVRTGRPELSDTVWLDELAAAAGGRAARALREAVVEEIAAAR